MGELEAGDRLEAPEVREKELELAEQLVAALDEEWDPEQFRDDYRDDLMELIEEKAKTGEAPVKQGGTRERGGEVVDMMELLKPASVRPRVARARRAKRRKAS